MAIIKCPKCEKKMSDKAASYPHCGYTPNGNKKNGNNILNDLKEKWNNKYLIVILILILGGYFLLNDDSQKNTDTGNQPVETKPNTNGNYEFNQNGKYFEFPSNYKAYIDKDGSVYVGKNIDDQSALIPYIMIEKYKNYTDPTQILSELTTAIGKEYPDAKITIDLVNGTIGNKNIYGIQYTYTSSGHVVVDNRYAFLVNNSMYLITTKEENTNTTEINNVTELIINTLKEMN